MKSITSYPELLLPSSDSNLAPESTQHLLEKVNSTIKNLGGSLTIIINQSFVDVRYAAANGILINIGDNQFSPSDMVSDVMNRVQALYQAMQEIELERATAVKKQLDDIAEAEGHVIGVH